MCSTFCVRVLWFCNDSFFLFFICYERKIIMSRLDLRWGFFFCSTSRCRILTSSDQSKNLSRIIFKNENMIRRCIDINHTINHSKSVQNRKWEDLSRDLPTVVRLRIWSTTQIINRSRKVLWRMNIIKSIQKGRASYLFMFISFDISFLHKYVLFCSILTFHQRQAKGLPWLNQSSSISDMAPMRPMIKNTNEYRRRR